MLDEIVTWQGLLSQGTRRMDEGVAGSGGGVERKSRVAVAGADEGMTRERIT